MDKVKELLTTLDLMAYKLKELFDEVNRQQKVINNLSKRLNDLEKTSYLQGQIIDKQSKSISKLSEYVDRINANSNAPFSEDVEEEIKKILE